MFSIPTLLFTVLATTVAMYATVRWVRFRTGRKSSKENLSSIQGIGDSQERGRTIDLLPESSGDDATHADSKPLLADQEEKAQFNSRGTDEHVEAAFKPPYWLSEPSSQEVNEPLVARTQMVEQPEAIDEVEKRSEGGSGNKPAENESSHSKTDVLEPEVRQISAELARKLIKKGGNVLEEGHDSAEKHTAPIAYQPVSDFEQIIRPYRYPIVKMPFPNSKVLYPKAYKAKKQGVSEDGFHKVLLSAFGKKIKRNLSLSFEGAKHDYEPDFGFVDAVYELFMDIEVDEPYSGISRKPMHYIGSYDQDRDRYFNQHGWVVIRFTEEQVVKQPIPCCHFIGKVLNALIPQYSFPEELALELKPVIQWTYEEAERMALENFRDSYLGVTFEWEENTEVSEIETEHEVDKSEMPRLGEIVNGGVRNTVHRGELELANKDLLTRWMSEGERYVKFSYSGRDRLVEMQQVHQERLSWILEGHDYVENKTALFELGKVDHLRQVDHPFLFEAEAVSAEQFREYVEMANDNNLYVQIHYQKWSGESSVRTLSYYQRDFVPGETRWWYTEKLYVRAYCNLRKEDRTFKFDRMQRMRVLNLSFG